MADQQRRYIILPLSAGLSGIVEACSTHPLDRVKTEMQRLALEKHPHPTLPTSVRSIYSSANHSVRGFYHGLLPRLIGIVPMRLTYWGTLHSLNDATSAREDLRGNVFVQYMLPGMVAGAVQSIVDNPIEVMKTKLMTGARTVDWRRIYDGFTPLVLRNVIFAVHVGACTKLFGGENPFLAGALGGLLGSIVTQPLDVIKTEMQRHQTPSSSLSVTTSSRCPSFQHICYDLFWQQPSLARLFSGLTMRCALSMSNMGIGYLVLRKIQQQMTWLFEEFDVRLLR